MLEQMQKFEIPEQMQKFVILMVAIAAVLIFIVLFCTSNSRLRKFIVGFFLEDVSENSYSPRENNTDSKNDKDTRDIGKKTSQLQIEMATLIRKSDDRRRVIESTGQTRIEDELYELIFKSRKGRTIIIECSKTAYESIPFNQQGSLTYKRNKLIKFKYFDGVVFNEPQ